jgi:RNA polymerase sigma factor (sigma-70 family)
VTSTEPHLHLVVDPRDGPIDESALLQAVRDGSPGAFATLYGRHRSFAIAVARRELGTAAEPAPEDVAEVAFLRVLTALRNGKGPHDTLRAYLATTVRREVWRAQRRLRRQDRVVDRWASERERSVDREPDLPAHRRVEGELGAHRLLGEAFGGLSERWRAVLWLTEVEGRKPAEVAPLLGLSAGSVSALAYRARNGLLAAYVAAYARSTTRRECAAIADRLGRHLAAGAPASGFEDVVAHLDGCAPCRDVSRGVDVLGASLGVLAPLGLVPLGRWASGTAAASGSRPGSAATRASGSGSGSAASSAATGASSGSIATGALAAVVGVVLIVGGGWFATARSDGGNAPQPIAAAGASLRPDAGRPSTPSPVPPRAPVATPRLTDDGTEEQVGSASKASGPVAATSTPPSPSPSPSPPSSPSSPPQPRAPRSQPAPPPPVATPSTTVPEVVEDPAPTGGVSGRVLEERSDVVGGSGGVAGIEVAIIDAHGRTVATTTTDADGRWQVARLLAGRYRALATVPSDLVPATGAVRRDTDVPWPALLGSIDLADQPVELADLLLAPR